MNTVAILTPDPEAAGDHALWQRVLQRLQSALSQASIAATPTPWTAHAEDADGLRGYDHVLPLLVWGYHRDHARWLRACSTWQAARLPLSNPAALLAWNSDKRYLEQLAQRGVDIPRTWWTERPTAGLLAQAFDETGTDALVIKPSVSGGAWKTLRVERDGIARAVREAPRGVELLVQPCLPTIGHAGETSLLFFGGRLSHVVNKRPVPGDFRVQEEFGGRYSLLPEAPAAALALAARALSAIAPEPLYARIDMVPDASGRWLLMEAELIEPDFYLGMDAAAGLRFAQALRERLRASAG